MYAQSPLSDRRWKELLFTDCHKQPKIVSLWVSGVSRVEGEQFDCRKIFAAHGRNTKYLGQKRIMLVPVFSGFSLSNWLMESSFRVCVVEVVIGILG